MPVYKRTNDNQGKVINTGGDYNKSTGVVKDVLHIVTSDEETSKLIACGFRFNIGLNELEVYLNGQLLRATEIIDGTSYGDYSEVSNFSVLFESGVIKENDQIRFRVTSNSYDRSLNNNQNLIQLAKDFYGRDVNTGLLNGNGIQFGNGIVNVLSYATEYDSVYGYYHEGTLSDALIEIGSTSKTLYIPKGTWRINDDITIPSNINLRIENGVILTISSGKTLTINGGFECGLYQCFSGSGSVIFGVGSIGIAYSKWWGLTDFTSGIQSSLPNKCMYVGTSGKLIFKDSSGVEHDLY